MPRRRNSIPRRHLRSATASLGMLANEAVVIEDGLTLRSSWCHHRQDREAAPPGPAQGWRSRDRWWLVAVEELVDRTVRPDIEVLGGVVLERRPVRAAATDVEGESAIHCVAVLVEAAPDGELAGVAGQARVLKRHGHKRAGLGEGGMDAAVVEGGGVLDQVAGGGDGVERPAPFAAGNDVHEGLDQVLLDGGLGDRRLGEGRRPDQQQAGGHQTYQQATNHQIPPRSLCSFAPGRTVIALPDHARHRQICRGKYAELTVAVRRRKTAMRPDPPECTRPTGTVG